MNKIKKITVGSDTLELDVDEKDAVILERQFAAHTKLDLLIQNLEIPKKPKWLQIAVRLIRYYQKSISPHLGNRCVFDPSCSHYAELAFRKKGFVKGALMTIKRLYRCRPKNGGTDLVN